MSIHKWLWHWRARIMERVPVPAFDVDNTGQKVPGQVSRGNPVTEAHSMGHNCPVSHPARVWNCCLSHCAVPTTQVLWDCSTEVHLGSTEGNTAEPPPLVMLQEQAYSGRRLDLSLYEQRKTKIPTSLPSEHLSPRNTWLHHLQPFLTLAFHSLRGFSCLGTLPLGKYFIKDIFWREEVCG